MRHQFLWPSYQTGWPIALGHDDPDHLDAVLTLYATAERAHAVAGRWQSTPYGAQRTLQRTAFDSVTVRASTPLDDRTVRLLGGCVGHQPAPANA